MTWRQIWVLIVFSLWHQIYVERVYDPVALGWEKRLGTSWSPRGGADALRTADTPITERSLLTNPDPHDLGQVCPVPHYKIGE